MIAAIVRRRGDRGPRRGDDRRRTPQAPCRSLQSPRRARRSIEQARLPTISAISSALWTRLRPWDRSAKAGASATSEESAGVRLSACSLRVTCKRPFTMLAPFTIAVSEPEDPRRDQAASNRPRCLVHQALRDPVVRAVQSRGALADEGGHPIEHVDLRTDYQLSTDIPDTSPPPEWRSQQYSPRYLKTTSERLLLVGLPVRDGLEARFGAFVSVFVVGDPSRRCGVLAPRIDRYRDLALSLTPRSSISCAGFQRGCEKPLGPRGAVTAGTIGAKTPPS